MHGLGPNLLGRHLSLKLSDLHTRKKKLDEKSSPRLIATAVQMTSAGS
jgi:hypothetical protein